MKSLCVYCGSSRGARPEYLEAAATLGETMARRGIRLVYGAGEVGMMGQVAKSCLDAGGEVTGITPGNFITMGVCHGGLTELIVTDTMHERKAEMSRLSDAFVALPGGLGTLEEIFEMYTWLQLGLHDRPVGLLNTLGYYGRLLDMLDHQVAEGFVLSAHRDMLVVEDGVDALLDRLDQAPPKVGEKWFDKEYHRIR
ncbi:MAG: TIGR00730 family Rossman fold protein [Desulfatibacillaceae bacterium]